MSPYLARLLHKERSKAASFIPSRGPALHQGFGGRSVFDPVEGRFQDPNRTCQCPLSFKPNPLAEQRRHLEEALRQYVPRNLGIQCPDNAWDDLFEKLAELERGCHEGDRSSRTLFWWKIGENREAISPWVNLIPDAYGLSVLKASIAVLLKLAEDSVERRDQIYHAFADLSEFLQTAMVQRKAFGADTKISDCANRLYGCLVEAIEDLIMLAAPPNHKPLLRECIPRFQGRQERKDIEAIIRTVRERTRALEQAVGGVRDEKIRDIERLSRNTNSQVSFVRQDVKSAEVNTRETLAQLDQQKVKIDLHSNILDRVDGNVLKTMTSCEEMRNAFIEDMAELKRFFDWIFSWNHSQIRARNSFLEMACMHLTESRNTGPHNAPYQMYSRNQTALLTTDRLIEIISASSSQHLCLKALVQHSMHDLKRAFCKTSGFSAKSQAQAQSVMRHDHFADWLGDLHPNLICVEANIPAAALERLPAMSVVCATLVAGVLKVRPNDVVISFFCGLHDTTKSPWYGPSGLVRSLIMQVLANLMIDDNLDLSFINDRGYLRSLEEHHLPSLCQTLHALVTQFPPETTVFCIIDGISCFDKERTFADLERVISYLHGIVADPKLVPNFKVLLTTPSTCSVRVRRSFEPREIVRLTSGNAFPSGISNRLVEARLSPQSRSQLRRPSPAFGPFPSGSY